MRVAELDLELVQKFSDAGRFNDAFALAGTLSVDITDLFEKFVEGCLSLTNPSSTNQ